MTKVLTIGFAESSEQIYGAGDDALDGLDGRNVVGPDRPVQVVETTENLTVFEEEVIGLGHDMRRWNVTVAGEVLQPLDPGGKEVGVFIQSVGPETIDDLGTERVEVDGIPLVTNTTIVPPYPSSSLEVGNLELIPTTHYRHEFGSVIRHRLVFVSITLRSDGLELVLTARNRTQRENIRVGGCN